VIAFVAEMGYVYCAVRTECLSIIHVKLGLKKKLTEGPAELSLGTSSYPRELQHNVKC
jgi:hypothetical protein